MSTIPRDTLKAWNSMGSSRELHPGLTFYRFLEGEREQFKAFLSDILGRIGNPLTAAVAARVKDQCEFLETNGWKKAIFRARLATRMAVGLGIPSRTENGIWLDHTHGIPLIPGSVLKGVAQDHALLACCDKLGLAYPSETGIAKRNEPGFVAVFGAQTPDKGAPDEHFEPRAGHGVFFDAFPLSPLGNPFEVDIMNPHYGDYYRSQGGTAPADYLKPNPIFFLTVKAGTEFQFAVAAREARFTLKRPDGTELPPCGLGAGEVLQLALEHLKGALTQLGVGGKTRVGYGLFEEVS